MKPFAQSLVGTVVAVVLVLGAYHVTLGAGARKRSAEPADAGGDLAALSKEVDRLAEEVRQRGGAGLASRLEERLAALDRRLADLEKGGGTEPASMSDGATPAADRTWTEQDLENVRAMLDEIAARKAKEQEEAAIVRLLKMAGANTDDPKNREAIPLIFQHNESIKSLWKAAFEGGRTTPNPDVVEEAAEQKRRLVANLSAMLPADVVTKLTPYLSELPRAEK